MVNLQIAGCTSSREAYKEFARLTNEQNTKVTVRGQLKFKLDPTCSVPLDKVEPASAIVKRRFASGAMSLGSISREAHETLAVAMKSIGARSCRPTTARENLWRPAGSCTSANLKQIFLA